MPGHHGIQIDPAAVGHDKASLRYLLHLQYPAHQSGGAGNQGNSRFHNELRFLWIKTGFQLAADFSKIVRIGGHVRGATEIAPSHIYIFQIQCIFISNFYCHTRQCTEGFHGSALGGGMQVQAGYFHSGNALQSFNRIPQNTILITVAEASPFSSAGFHSGNQTVQKAVYPKADLKFPTRISLCQLLRPFQLPGGIQVDIASGKEDPFPHCPVFYGAVIYDLIILVPQATGQIVLHFGNHFRIEALLLQPGQKPGKRIGFHRITHDEISPILFESILKQLHII